MAITLIPSLTVTSTPEARGHQPMIGYRNLLEDAVTLVATSTAAGLDVRNLYSGLPDEWGPAARGTIYITATFAKPVTVDYAAFFGTNLGAVGGSLALEYWDGSAWVNFVGPSMPATTECTFLTADAVGSSQWRAVLYCNAAGSGLPLIRHLFFGKRLDLPVVLGRGLRHPEVGQDDETLTTLSQGGSFIGSAVRRVGVDITVPLKLLTRTWMETYWPEFRDHMAGRPFFYVWDSSDDHHAAFCWATRRSQPQFSGAGFLENNLQLHGHFR